MVKCVVGGQMDKQSIEELIKKAGGDDVAVRVMGDLEATLAIQSGMADYYFGACATGSGGALGMAMGLLGPALCVSVSIPGKIMSDTEIDGAVKEGKKAFGFVNNDAEKVIPVLLQSILRKE